MRIEPATVLVFGQPLSPTLRLLTVKGGVSRWKKPLEQPRFGFVPETEKPAQGRDRQQKHFYQIAVYPRVVTRHTASFRSLQENLEWKLKAGPVISDRVLVVLGLGSCGGC